MHTLMGGSSFVGGSIIGISNASLTGLELWGAPDTAARLAAFGPGVGTNFVFGGHPLVNYDPRQAATTASHENGHAFGNQHQVRNIGDPPYPNAYMPIMDLSASPATPSTRMLWAIGIQEITEDPQNNDVTNILQIDPGLNAFADSGNGHIWGSATPLAVSAGVVDPAISKGIITPSSLASPNPIGVANYTEDYFKFTANGSISLTLNDGSEWIQTGVADPGAMLDATLKIYDSSFQLVGQGTPDALNLSRTFTGSLNGDYYAVISDIGGYQYTHRGGQHRDLFTMGSYFLTGNGAFAGVAGDYNGNGVVDAADYVLWRNGGPLANEVDVPGTVNAADYTAWRARFGNASGSGAGLGASVPAVPEPALPGLLMLGIPTLLVRWRKATRIQGDGSRFAAKRLPSPLLLLALGRRPKRIHAA